MGRDGTTGEDDETDGGTVDPTEPWGGTPYPELYWDAGATTDSAGRETRTPVCRALAARSSADIDLVLVHHLHDTGEAFVRALADQFTIRKIIGIPYSAVPAVVERLRASFDVVVPESTGAIPGLIEEAVQSSTAPVVVEEIGGYSTEISGTLDGEDHVRGVVEDTNQGYWRWEETSVDSLAVLSVADCALKRVEDSVVGKSVVDGVARFLSVVGADPLADRHVHVLGYGQIGSATAAHLDGHCEAVSVHDTDPVRRLVAATRHEVTDAVERADVVIGATGNPDGSVHGSDLSDIPDGTVLVSASSRQVEFDLNGFADRAASVDRSGRSLTYTVGGRRILVANDGEPINLRYSRLPSRTLDLVYGALVYCITELADGTASAGLREISPAAQRTVADLYLDRYDI